MRTIDRIYYGAVATMGAGALVTSQLDHDTREVVLNTVAFGVLPTLALAALAMMLHSEFIKKR